MTRSKTLAAILGPSITALMATEALNFHIWKVNIAPVTYLSGLVLFVSGLSIVHVHNRWTRSWPVLITIVGWGLSIGGLYRMCAPEAPQASPSLSTYAGLAAGVVAGVFLTFKAYGREGVETERRSRRNVRETDREQIGRMFVVRSHELR